MNPYECNLASRKIARQHCRPHSAIPKKVNKKVNDVAKEVQKLPVNAQNSIGEHELLATSDIESIAVGFPKYLTGNNPKDSLHGPFNR